MSFEQSQFGFGGSVTAQVNNHYGPRSTGKAVGDNPANGKIRELVIVLDSEEILAGAFPLIAPTLPAGSRVEDVFAQVTEAFVVGGTSPVVDVGTETSEATNGFTITEAQLEAVGNYDLTGALSGTWSGATGLVADTILGVAGSGGTFTLTAAGRVVITIRYVQPSA